MSRQLHQWCQTFKKYYLLFASLANFKHSITITLKYTYIKLIFGMFKKKLKKIENIQKIKINY